MPQFKPKNNRVRVRVKAHHPKTQTKTKPPPPPYIYLDIPQRALFVPASLLNLKVRPTVAILANGWRIQGKHIDSLALFNVTIAYPVVSGERKSTASVKNLPPIAKPLAVKNGCFVVGSEQVVEADIFAVYKGKGFVIGAKTKQQPDKPNKKGKI